MNFVLDSHTHTVASGHAYSTLMEMARAAADQGLKLLCITDHAPGMEGTTNRDYFSNARIIDRELFGVQLMIGVELNILDTQGKVDLDQPLLSKLDLGVASLHTKCIAPGGDAEGYTHAVISAMDNPYINIIGHPDDGRYPLHYSEVVRAAGEKGVLLEVNNSSLTPGCFRKNAPVHCVEMLRLCKQEEVPVVVGSDAHMCTYVGRHQYAEALLKELDFPEELVINRDSDAFRAFVNAHRSQKK